MLDMIVFQCCINLVINKLWSTISNYVSWKPISLKYMEHELYDEILYSSRQCLCFNPFGDIICFHQNICFLVLGWVNWTDKIGCPLLKWFNNQLWVQEHFIRLTRASYYFATVTSLDEFLCIFEDHRPIIPSLEHLMSSSLIGKVSTTWSIVTSFQNVKIFILVDASPDVHICSCMEQVAPNPRKSSTSLDNLFSFIGGRMFW